MKKITEEQANDVAILLHSYGYIYNWLEASFQLDDIDVYIIEEHVNIVKGVYCYIINPSDTVLDDVRDRIEALEDDTEHFPGLGELDIHRSIIESKYIDEGNRFYHEN